MASRVEDRYIKLETKTLPNGQVVYKSAIPRVITTTDNDITFTANERDRMDIIASNTYGSPEDWWRIAAANGRVNGSLHFHPGTTITIPRAQ